MRPLDKARRTLLGAKSSREIAMQGGRNVAWGMALCGGLVLAGAALAQSPAMPGQALAFSRDKGNCLTCHDIQGGDSPGNVAPPLSNMKARFPDRNALTAIIFDETKRNPQTVMPPFGRNLILTREEIESIVDFLYTR
jgi:sulfur-oxidizing protein SoxX